MNKQYVEDVQNGKKANLISIDNISKYLYCSL